MLCRDLKILLEMNKLYCEFQSPIVLEDIYEPFSFKICYYPFRILKGIHTCQERVVLFNEHNFEKDDESFEEEIIVEILDNDEDIYGQLDMDSSSFLGKKELKNKILRKSRNKKKKKKKNFCILVNMRRKKTI